MKLGELLELLYTGRNRFSSIQVTCQYWYRVDLMNEAHEKWAAQHPPGSVSALKSESAKGVQNEMEMKIHWRVWWQKPSCWRDEEQIEGQGTTIRIRCEGRWWSFNSASRKLYTNVVPQEKPPYLRIHKSKRHRETHFPDMEDLINDMPLIDPSFLLASHDLQPMESTIYTE